MLSLQGNHSVEITPSDTVDLPQPMMIRFGDNGSLKVTTLGGETTTWNNCIAGATEATWVSRVWATGSTISDLHGIY